MVAFALVWTKTPVRMTSIILGVVIISAVRCQLSVGKDPPGQTVVDQPVPFDSIATIRSLENRNPHPLVRVPRGGPDHIALFDKDYNWSEYERVRKAIQTLAANAEEAFPELVAHLDDGRYCTTVWFPGSSVDMEENESVGDVCRMIIANWLSAPYSRDLGAGPPKIAYGWLIAGGVPQTGDRMKFWCEQQKGKRLYELQIETCKWVASHVRNVPELGDEDRKAIANSVQGKIDRLETTKRAIRFERFNFRFFSRETARFKKKAD
jgi:hypothetical protein